MKKLEVNKVFSLFDYSNEEIPQYIEDVKSNPYVRIGEVVHGVVNYFLIDQIYINKKVPGYVDKRESLREDFFNKIYRFLEGIDVTECGDRFMVTDSYDSERSVKVLKVLLKHFEQVEHYEKCANILRFINILS